MNLGELHTAVTAVLVDVNEDWPVLDPVDAVDPPVFIVQAGHDPWLTVQSMCSDWAEIQVVAIVARLTPEANYPALLDMVDQAADALAQAGFRPYDVLRPEPFEIAAVTYLASRLEIRHPVDRQTGA